MVSHISLISHIFHPTPTVRRYALELAVKEQAASKDKELRRAIIPLMDQLETVCVCVSGLQPQPNTSLPLPSLSVSVCVDSACVCGGGNLVEKEGAGGGGGGGVVKEGGWR